MIVDIDVASIDNDTREKKNKIVSFHLFFEKLQLYKMTIEKMDSTTSVDMDVSRLINFHR